MTASLSRLCVVVSTPASPFPEVPDKRVPAHVGVKKTKKFLEVGKISSPLRHVYLRRMIVIAICEKCFCGYDSN